MGTKALSDYMTEGALTVGSVGHSIGDLKFNERYIPISSTHPWKNLADADEELDEANYPDYVPVMRDVYIRRLQVTSYPIDFIVVAETIVSNVVTLTIHSSPNHQAFINSLAEMVLDYTKGSTPTPTDYANLNLCLRTIKPIGSVPVGEYTITNINPSARTIQFTYVHADESNSGLIIYGLTVPIYRVPGDSTKCRHRQQLGKAIMTPDFETFFNGVSWRDHLEDHEHATQMNMSSGGGALKQVNATLYNAQELLTSSVQNARTDSQTYPSGLGAFAYRYVGRYVAP